MWKSHLGNLALSLSLSKNPSQLSVRKILQKQSRFANIDSNIPPETKMVTKKGLGVFDTIIKILGDVQAQLADIHGPELLKYLTPGKERPDGHKSSENVHDGNVKFDLEFLRVVKYDFLLDMNVKREDLRVAFRNRYGDYPEAFPGDFPGEVARIINMKSALMHQNIWTNPTSPEYHERILMRDGLIHRCNTAIQRWFQQTPPYSVDEVAETLANLRKDYDREMELIREKKSSV